MPHGIILSRRTGRGGLLSATSENSGAGESSAADREWEPLNGIQVLKSALKHWVSLGAYGFLWQYGTIQTRLKPPKCFSKSLSCNVTLSQRSWDSRPSSGVTTVSGIRCMAVTATTWLKAFLLLRRRAPASWRFCTKSRSRCFS